MTDTRPISQAVSLNRRKGSAQTTGCFDNPYGSTEVSLAIGYTVGHNRLRGFADPGR